MNDVRLAIVILALAMTSTLQAEGEKRLKTEFQDIEPKFILVDGVPSGISYEIMKYVERKGGFSFSYPMKTVPLSRVLANLESGAIDVQFGLHRTPERERSIVYGPALYEVRTIGVVRNGEYGERVSISDLIARRDTALTPHGTALSSRLKTISGLSLDEGAWSVEANLRKLAEGRGDILLYHDLTIRYVLSNSRYRDRLRIVQVDFHDGFDWALVSQRLAYSRNVPETTMSEINGIVETARANGDLEAITGKYFR